MPAGYTYTMGSDTGNAAAPSVQQLDGTDRTRKTVPVTRTGDAPMSLQAMARVGFSALAVCAGSILLGSQQQQAPYYGSQTVYGPANRQVVPVMPQGQPAQHAPGEAYTVPVQPCGEFGKPPCGTVVTIPAGATGASLFAMVSKSVAAGRLWEAIIYIDQSAILGYAPAESALGADFAVGLQVPKDMVKARYWLQKAADQGNGASQAAMGELYAYAEGGPQDMAKAIHYYQLAAAQHVPRGELNLGIDYELGYGVSHDRAKAISLLRRAAVDDRRLGFPSARPADYANALSRAGTRRFDDPWELAAYVYPAPKQTQTQQSNVPAGCPGEPHFGGFGYGFGYAAQWCSRHFGCPYQIGVLQKTCPAYQPGMGVN